MTTLPDDITLKIKRTSLPLAVDEFAFSGLVTRSSYKSLDRCEAGVQIPTQTNCLSFNLL